MVSETLQEAAQLYKAWVLILVFVEDGLGGNIETMDAPEDEQS